LTATRFQEKAPDPRLALGWDPTRGNRGCGADLKLNQDRGT